MDKRRNALCSKDMPSEILMFILSKLNKAQDLTRVYSICHRFRSHMSTDSRLCEMRTSWNAILLPDVDLEERTLRDVAKRGILYLEAYTLRSDDMKTLSKAMQSGALDTLTHLNLNYTVIGDVGITALADSLSEGALPNIMHLFLDANKIGDTGMSALAGACDSGALERLHRLHLAGNRIGDTGATALARAISRGGLPKLRSLLLHRNQIGSNGMTALMGVVEYAAYVCKF